MHGGLVANVGRNRNRVAAVGSHNPAQFIELRTIAHSTREVMLPAYFIWGAVTQLTVFYIAQMQKGTLVTDKALTEAMHVAVPAELSAEQRAEIHTADPKMLPEILYVPNQ